MLFYKKQDKSPHKIRPIPKYGSQPIFKNEGFEPKGHLFYGKLILNFHHFALCLFLCIFAP